MEFSDIERAILRIVQKDLPDSLTPFADIAKEVGTDEATVLALLQRLKKSGAIRRFGATLRHQRAGWNCNAMVAWKIDEKMADEIGHYIAKHPRISHCYYRPSSAPDWQYSFYTMIHGRSEQECLDVVEELRRATQLDEYAILTSLKELKKTSMTYFESVTPPIKGRSSSAECDGNKNFS